MSRYIDADALMQKLDIKADCKECNNIDHFLCCLRSRDFVNACEAINDAPSIDIVRCKECKWRKTDNSCDLNCRIEYLDGTETDMWFYVKPDDFCSYGEREGK